MKKVMVRAWEIAKAGQKEFGGNVSEYLAEALRMAWAESRTATITTTSGSRKHKSWVAKITGTDTRFGLKREFVEAVEEDSWTGKVFELGNGIYEVCNAGEREFIQVVDGKVKEIRKSEAVEMVA